jgi:[ribosomal protein S5]-alanine N-acetyltransferase
MALFRLPTGGPAALVPRGHGLLLRAPQMADFPQWAQLREQSRTYLTPWEPIWPSDDLTRAGFRRRLRRYAEDIAADRSYPFIIFRERDGNFFPGGGRPISSVPHVGLRWPRSGVGGRRYLRCDCAGSGGT